MLTKRGLEWVADTCKYVLGISVGWALVAVGAVTLGHWSRYAVLAVLALIVGVTAEMRSER